MDPSQMSSDYWIDDVGVGSDGELRCAFERFCDIPLANGVRFQEGYGDGCSVDHPSSRKRGRDEACTGPKSKACREKMRRDRLNDRFSQLSSVLDPDMPPRSDKVSISSDAARLLVQLKAEAEQLKESNEKLQETIKELKVEKNELRDEKTRLKEDRERLEQQVKAMSAPPPAFMPHPMALHPASQTRAASKKGAPYNAFPPNVHVAMVTSRCHGYNPRHQALVTPCLSIQNAAAIINFFSGSVICFSFVLALLLLSCILRQTCCLLQFWSLCC